jgi:hypothetical protein
MSHTQNARPASRVLVSLALFLGVFALVPQASFSVDCGVESQVLGEIEAIDSVAGTVTVDGTAYGTDSDTEYRLLNGDDGSFEDFAVGNYVEVEFCPGPPPVATKLRQRDPLDGCENEIRGFIESIDAAGGSLVVSGVTVTTQAATEYLDDDNNPLPGGLSDFATGDFVEAEGCPQPDGSLTASKVKLEDEDGDDNFQFEFRGFIESTDPVTNTLVVAGQNVTTGAGTEYLDDNNNALTNGFADLMAGQFVEVEGAPLATGFFFASKIKFEDDFGDNPGDEQEIRGEISNADAIALTLVINNFLIQTNAQTSFLGFNNETVGFEVFTVGSFAEAEGALQGDGSILARKVKLEDRVGVGFERRGAIDSIDGTTITVAGEAIATTPTTTFLGLNNEPLTLGDFAASEFVEAEGDILADGSLQASKVKKEDAGGIFCNPTFIASGALLSINAETGEFVFGADIQATADASTQVEDEAHLPIAFADLMVGDFIEVKGNQDAETLLIAACEIERRNGEDNGGGNGGGEPETVLNGVIESIDFDLLAFFLGETLVSANLDTEIEGRRGEILAFADLANGFQVVVRGRALADGRFLASHIRVQEENTNPGDDQTSVEAVIASLDLGASALTLDSGTAVDLSAAPAVIILDGAAGTLADLGVGDLVKVEGAAQLDGSLLASRIEVRASAIAEINLETQTILVGATTVNVLPATEIREADLTPLTLEDLIVGDLVQVHGVPSLEGTGVDATEITRLASPEFGGEVAGFVAPAFSLVAGLPTLSTTQNQDVFGFVSMPANSESIDANKLYEATVTVSTSVTDRTLAPQTRLRVNNQSFQKGMTLDLDSNGAARFSPTPAGVEHKLYYVPAVPPTAQAEFNDDWFFSLDMANVLGRDQADASVTLNSLKVREISRDQLQVAETLVDNSFSRDSEGWTFAGVPGFFTLPTAASGLNGTLDLAAPDANSFGYWTVNTGVEAQAGSLYRGRFLVRSSSQANAQVPTIRLRLNLSTYEMASIVNVESIEQGEESPDGAGRYYDAYLFIPGDATGATILASFDLANVAHAEDDENKAISLDRFLLERVTIAE